MDECLLMGEGNNIFDCFFYLITYRVTIINIIIKNNVSNIKINYSG